MFRYQAAPNYFLKFQLTTYNPRIAGTNSCVVFYDGDTGSFNDIQVGTVYQNSDERMKTNIVSIGEALPLVKELNPVSFNWIANPKDNNKNHNRTLNGAKLKEMGFLSQDVEKVIPGAVITDEEGHKLLNYSAIIPVLTKAIQELQSQVEALQKNANTTSVTHKTVRRVRK